MILRAKKYNYSSHQSGTLFLYKGYTILRMEESKEKYQIGVLYCISRDFNKAVGDEFVIESETKPTIIDGELTEVDVIYDHIIDENGEISKYHPMKALDSYTIIDFKYRYDKDSERIQFLSHIFCGQKIYGIIEDVCYDFEDGMNTVQLYVENPDRFSYKRYNFQSIKKGSDE